MLRARLCGYVDEIFSELRQRRSNDSVLGLQNASGYVDEGKINLRNVLARTSNNARTRVARIVARTIHVQSRKVRLELIVQRPPNPQVTRGFANVNWELAILPLHPVALWQINTVEWRIIVWESQARIISHVEHGEVLQTRREHVQRERPLEVESVKIETGKAIGVTKLPKSALHRWASTRRIARIRA